MGSVFTLPILAGSNLLYFGATSSFITDPIAFRSLMRMLQLIISVNSGIQIGAQIASYEVQSGEVETRTSKLRIFGAAGSMIASFLAVSSILTLSPNAIMGFYVLGGVQTI